MYVKCDTAKMGNSVIINWIIKPVFYANQIIMFDTQESNSDFVWDVQPQLPQPQLSQPQSPPNKKRKYEKVATEEVAPNPSQMIQEFRDQAETTPQTFDSFISEQCAKKPYL